MSTLRHPLRTPVCAALPVLVTLVGAGAAVVFAAAPRPRLAVGVSAFLVLGSSPFLDFPFVGRPRALGFSASASASAAGSAFFFAGPRPRLAGLGTSSTEAGSAAFERADLPRLGADSSTASLVALAGRPGFLAEVALADLVGAGSGDSASGSGSGADRFLQPRLVVVSADTFSTAFAAAAPRPRFFGATGSEMVSSVFEAVLAAPRFLDVAGSATNSPVASEAAARPRRLGAVACCSSRADLAARPRLLGAGSSARVSSVATGRPRFRVLGSEAGSSVAGASILAAGWPRRLGASTGASSLGSAAARRPLFVAV
ncbi:hypothetical protein HG531_000661 [Fusarium graminearum]|nr:hypothetical protein HG531_000661 [Fusarium graminearum]